MVWPMVKGPDVTSVLTTDTSADGRAVPPAVVVLFAVLGSKSFPFAVAVLLNAPAAVIVAVTVMTRVFPMTMNGGLLIVHGSEEQLAPLTVWMVIFVGVSFTTTNPAADGPAL